MTFNKTKQESLICFMCAEFVANVARLSYRKHFEVSGQVHIGFEYTCDAFARSNQDEVVI